MKRIMKNLKLLLIFLTVLCVICGCDQTPQETQTEKQPELQSQNESHTPIESDTEWYSTHIEIEKDYCQENKEMLDSVSETLLESYGNADTVSYIPILGKHLEKTSSVLFLFYKDNTICSTAILDFDSSEESLDIDSVEFATGKHTYGTNANEECYARMKECHSTNIDFEVMGIILFKSGTSYALPMPVGRCKGETVIKLVLNEPTDFTLVEPFESIEEGRAAYAYYHAKMDFIKAQLPTYSWKAAEFYESGYWRPYTLDTMYDDTQEYQDMISPLTFLADSWITRPLLDESFEEGKLITHLVFYRGAFIGEIVLKDYQEEKGYFVILCEYAKIAEKGADGSYIPLEKSEYQIAIETAKSLYPDIEIEGVVFKDGKYMPFGHRGEEIVYLID